MKKPLLKKPTGSTMKKPTGSAMKKPGEDKESAYRQRIKKQFSVDPEFIGRHPQDKTEGGVYEFEIAVSADKKRRCFMWHFAPGIGSGQMAMDVADPDTQTTPDEIVAQWLATRKLIDRAIR